MKLVVVFATLLLFLGLASIEAQAFGDARACIDMEDRSQTAERDVVNMCSGPVLLLWCTEGSCGAGAAFGGELRLRGNEETTITLERRPDARVIYGACHGDDARWTTNADGSAYICSTLTETYGGIGPMVDRLMADAEAGAPMDFDSIYGRITANRDLDNGVTGYEKRFWDGSNTPGPEAISPTAEDPTPEDPPVNDGLIAAIEAQQDCPEGEVCEAEADPGFMLPCTNGNSVLVTITLEQAGGGPQMVRLRSALGTAVIPASGSNAAKKREHLNAALALCNELAPGSWLRQAMGQVQDGLMRSDAPPPDIPYGQEFMQQGQ